MSSPLTALGDRYRIEREVGAGGMAPRHGIACVSTRTPPTRWATGALFSDPRFADTPEHSHKATPDGRVLYLQGPPRTSASYLRVVPGWVEEMKRAVDRGN